MQTEFRAENDTKTDKYYLAIPGIAKKMSIAYSFLGFLDLIICALVFKICLSQSSDSKLLVDKQT